MAIFEILQHEPDSRRIKAGETIFSEGAPGDNMYAVLDGEIEIRKADVVLETVRRGGIFGEMALIDEKTRSAGAIATADSTIVAIGQRRFMTLVQQTPFFAVQVMQVLSARLRRNTES